ncbi:MAG TPA: ABC transporter permease [Bryobacteraceae bacterium]|nr:ABC transporter permease [Bryobacteraceae bacterium]
MNDLWRVVSAEGLKLKRTLALRLALGSPMMVVLLVFGIYLQRGGTMGGPDPLRGFAQLILTIWTIIVFPLYAALAAALLAAIEHQGENWKHLLALPVPRAVFFCAKWIAGIGLLTLSSLVLAAGVLLTAEILRLTTPVWRPSPLPVLMIFRGALLSCCAAGLLFSIQMWISLRWRSFLPGMVVAVMALAMMFIAIPRGSNFFGSLFPWSLPAMAMAPVNPYRPIAVGFGFLGGVLVGAAACWTLSQHEFC